MKPQSWIKTEPGLQEHMSKPISLLKTSRKCTDDDKVLRTKFGGISRMLLFVPVTQRPDVALLCVLRSQSHILRSPSQENPGMPLRLMAQKNTQLTGSLDHSQAPN